MSAPFLDRLRGGLARTREVLETPVGDLLSGRRPLDPAALQALEEALLEADLGLPAVQEAMERLRRGPLPGGISARNLGEAFLEEKNYGEAVNWFRTSVNRHKSYADPYLGLADALVGLGRVEEALAQLEIGAKEAPENPGLLLSLGQLYFRVGRFKEARTSLESALKKDPGGPSGRRAGEVLKELPK